MKKIRWQCGPAMASRHGVRRSQGKSWLKTCSISQALESAVQGDYQKVWSRP